MPLFKTGTWWDKVQSQIDAMMEERLDAERAAEGVETTLPLQEQIVEMEGRRADALGGKDEPAPEA